MGLTRYSDGAPVTLAERIADSGEAEIRAVAGTPDILAKIYHGTGRPAGPDRERAAKLAALIARPPADPSLGGFHRAFAWPTDVLRDAHGQAVGLLIPAVPGARGLTALGSTKLRRRKAAEINWHYLHALAANLSFAVDHAHAQGFVIGDLQPDNVLVDDRALVTLIDCDSWQIPDPRAAGAPPFPCPVGTEGFTAPELIGKNLKRAPRTPASDRFALAVLIFQLLLGRHPWTGEWIGGGDPPTRDSLIKSGDWPHRHGSRLIPAKGAVPLEVLAPNLAALFRRAFARGVDDPAARPTGGEWQEALCLALAALESCPDRPHHHYLPERGACPWCARLAATGSDAFPEPATPSDPFWPLALAFERALARGDARMALDLWRESPALADRPALRRYRARMAEIGTALDALDGWASAYRRALEGGRPDWSHLARLWESDPALADRRLFIGEEIAGRPALSLLDEVREQALRIPLAPPERLLVTPRAAIRAAELRRHQPAVSRQETSRPGTPTGAASPAADPAAAPTTTPAAGDSAPASGPANGLDIPPMPVSLADPARRRANPARAHAPAPPHTPAPTLGYEITAGWAGLRPAQLTLRLEKPARLPKLALVEARTGRVVAALPAGRMAERTLRLDFEQPDTRVLLELRVAAPADRDSLTIAHPPERARRIGARRADGFDRRPLPAS
nr:hypothetical protein [Marivibrio halodurans]